MRKLAYILLYIAVVAKLITSSSIVTFANISTAFKSVAKFRPMFWYSGHLDEFNVGNKTRDAKGESNSGPR